ncbi:helix-turn-helix domain-containing protein [Candidatus Gottesmanbacteria bacterium]|nr:helix-turn-helix domain-containing protein [Candidatus Gottesmanbacteria bacterium]
MKRIRLDPLPTDTPSSYPTKEMKELFSAILAIESIDEATTFFRDLLTVSEIKEFANRWQAVKLLTQGKSYADIAEKLGMSTATVTRVAHWLKNGMGGYQLIVNRVLTKPNKSYHHGFRLRGKHSFLKPIGS